MTLDFQMDAPRVYGRFPSDSIDVLEAVASPVRWRIATYLDKAKMARFNELQRFVKKTSGSLAPHLRAMQRGGIIRKVHEKREHWVEVYELTPFGSRFIDLYHQAFEPVTIHRRFDGEFPSKPTIELKRGEERTEESASGRLIIA